jgi:hypothetical protein
VSCGCETDSDHGDARHITLLILRCAAEAAGISTQQAAANIAAAFPPEIAGTAVEVEPLEPDPVMKALEVVGTPKRFVLGVAYPADRIDGHHEFMTVDEVERTAWDYARNHRRIGFFHVDGTESHAEVCESYIYRGPDWVTADIDGKDQVIKSGDWMLGAILDEPGFDLVRRRKADGWSVDGLARRRKRKAPNR